MYTVIGKAQSRAFRVLWMLEELGLPYRHDPSLPHSDAVTLHNPSGKVPVLLTEDGTALTDSTAILTFLADSEGRMTAPAGTVARARQDALTQFLLGEFDALIWTAARHSFILPQEHRLPAIKDSLRWELARNAALLARMLGDGPFLTGSELTVPDILCAHCLSWARVAKFPVAEPALDAYMARIAERPAYATAMDKARAAS